VISLLNNAELIRDRQGYIKNIEDIKTICLFIHKPFISRRFLTDGRKFKPANKLLCALNNELYRRDLVDFKNDNYKNLALDCSFLDLPTEEVSVREIVYLNVPVDDYFTVDLYKKRNNPFEKMQMKGLTKRKRKEINALYSTFLGQKRVDPSVKYIFNLAKKCEDDEEMMDLLYKLYLNWYQSKLSSHQKHVDLHNELSEIVCQLPIRTNRASRRYFMDINTFSKCVKHETPCPKRFLNIVKFCSSLRDRKAVKNNSYVDKMARMCWSLSTKEDTGIVLPESSHYKFTANAKVFNWLKGLINSLDKYLTYRDIFVANSVFKSAVTDTRQLSEKVNLSLMGRRVKRRMSNQLIRSMLQAITKGYLGEDNPLDYADYLKLVKREIKEWFANPELPKILFNRRFKLKHILAKDYSNSSELLKALSSQPVSDYLTTSEINSLTRPVKSSVVRAPLLKLRPLMSYEAALLIQSKVDFHRPKEVTEHNERIVRRYIEAHNGAILKIQKVNNLYKSKAYRSQMLRFLQSTTQLSERDLNIVLDSACEKFDKLINFNR